MSNERCETGNRDDSHKDWEQQLRPSAKNQTKGAVKEKETNAQFITSHGSRFRNNQVDR